jgi:probable phosphoglycerate mutase
VVCIIDAGREETGIHSTRDRGLRMPTDAREIWSPPPRRRVYLMRHADVEYFDPAGRPHRPETVPLTEAGRGQAEAAALALREVAFDRAVTSGLPRTEQTAQLILAGRGVPVEAEPRLREIETGRMSDWASVSPEMVLRVILGALPADLNPETRFLGGETFASLDRRVMAAWGALVARRDWRALLVVAHGVANRLLLARLLGAPLGALGRLEQDACCLNLVEVDDAGTPLVRLVNHTADNPHKLGMHLSTLEGLYRQYLQGRAPRRD